MIRGEVTFLLFALLCV